MGLYIVVTCVLFICLTQPSHQQDDEDAIVECPSLRINNLTVGCSLNGARVSCSQAPVGMRVKPVWKKSVLEKNKQVTDLTCMKSGAWEPADDTGYQTIGNGRYKWYPQQKRLITGNECRKDNAYLIVIDSLEELNALKPFMEENIKKSGDCCMYMGIHAIFKSHAFSTVLYKEFKNATYLPWHKGEPNNLPGEDCVIMEVLINELYDTTCDRGHAYICKKY